MSPSNATPLKKKKVSVRADRSVYLQRWVPGWKSSGRLCCWRCRCRCLRRGWSQVRWPASARRFLSPASYGQNQGGWSVRSTARWGQEWAGRSPTGGEKHRRHYIWVNAWMLTSCLFLLEEFDCYPHVRVYWEYENSLVNLCLSGGDWSPACFVTGINWTRRRHVSLCRETQHLLCCLWPTWKICHYYNVHILTKQQTKQW